MARIVRLDPVISSQIAAGEVIERPASVVKELVENSLDAGATSVTVEFEESGLDVIRVIDNGSGMSREDAELAVERFATSKLNSIDDLHGIGTLGFRGEALPSIASVSNLTLETKETGAGYGAEVRVAGGEVVGVSEKGLPVGTTVTVRNLFFNTPARLQFMKSKTKERQAVIEVVERLALSWPDRRFLVRSGGKNVLITSGQGLRNAIADLYGPDALSSMIPVAPVENARDDRESVEVKGMVGLPGLYRRTRDRQVFSVNSRPVKSPLLSWALDEAYRGLLPPKSYPVAILNISPGDDVDVNVHPAKAEVRFKNEGAVRSAVIAAVSRALVRSGLSTLDSDRKMDDRDVAGQAPARAGAPSWSSANDYDTSHRYVRDGPAWGGFTQSVIGDTMPVQGPDAPPGSELPGGWRYLGSIKDTYLVAATPDSLIAVDKHALMESLIFGELMEKRSGGQELLMAEVLRLSPKEAAVYEESEAALSATGFGSKLVGEYTVMVTKVPLILGKPVDPKAIREVLMSLSSDPSNRASPERLLEASRISLAACHASVRAREPLAAKEAESLLLRLYGTPSASVCPHGRPTVWELPFSSLNDFFGRTSHSRMLRI